MVDYCGGPAIIMVIVCQHSGFGFVAKHNRNVELW